MEKAANALKHQVLQLYLPFQYRALPPALFGPERVDEATRAAVMKLKETNLCGEDALLAVRVLLDGGMHKVRALSPSPPSFFFSLSLTF